MSLAPRHRWKAGTLAAIRRSPRQRERARRLCAREDRYMRLQAEVYEAWEAGWRPDVERLDEFEQMRVKWRSAAGLPIDD